MALEAPEKVELTVRESPPIIPHRLIEKPPWWRREAEGIETAVLWLTTWILSLTYVFAGIVIGVTVSYLFELSMIIFG
jgi:hypothetical protein